MRSWSIPVGRLFGVDVRLHLTFFVLPMFIFWTDYAAHQDNANGPRDLAIVGIILLCVAIHECGHMLAARRFGLIPKAVILLPLTGVALYDESRTEKPQPAAQLWKREIRLALVGPLASLAAACLAAAAVICLRPGNRIMEVALPPSREFAQEPGVGEPLPRGFQSHARVSPRRRANPEGLVLAHSRSLHCDSARRLHQQCHRHGSDFRGLVQR